MNVTGISVVIPNYNGVALLPVTLPTVFEALDKTELPFEVIVVDDCSTDDSVAWVKENYSSVKIVLNEINSGFSISCNKGVHKSIYDKVLLLNSDVKLTPNYFLHQFKYFENEKTFGVMGRIVGWEDDKIQDGAKYPYFHGAKIKTSGNYILNDETRMKEGLYSMYLSGANAFVDKEKFLLIGGLNEIFSPFYVEDYELSLRAWRLGFICWFDYESVCRHRVSYSIKSKAKKSNIETIYYRNKMYLHAIHLEGYKKLVWFMQISIGAIARLLILQFYFIRAWFKFLFSLNKVKKSHREFNGLSEKLNSRLTVREVADIVLTHTKDGVIKF